MVVMPLVRLHRRAVAWLLAACLLFAQSAAIAAACPRDAAAAQTPCAEHLADDGTGAAAAGAVPEANVCEVHCQPVFVPDAGVDVPAPPAIVAWRLPPLAAAPAAAAPMRDLQARSASPPARTLLSRLLI